MSHLVSRIVRPLIAALAASLAVTAPATVAARSCWSPPVAAPVVDPFRPPACAWCPGNRGLEYGARAGRPVRAVASGHVTFAGTVAGTRYLVVRHPDGRRATYGNLTDLRVERGDLVVRRAIVGLAAGHVHFGLRDGHRYVDPAPFIGRLVRRPRLVPVDGSAAPPGPPARVRCGGL